MNKIVQCACKLIVRVRVRQELSILVYCTHFSVSLVLDDAFPIIWTCDHYLIQKFNYSINVSIHFCNFRTESRLIQLESIDAVVVDLGACDGASLRLQALNF